MRRLLEPLIRGRLRGLLFLTVLTLPPSYWLIGRGYGQLNLWAAERVAGIPAALPASTIVTAPFDFPLSPPKAFADQSKGSGAFQTAQTPRPAVEIIREVEGKPLLGGAPIADEQTLARDGSEAHRMLLSRYRARNNQPPPPATAVANPPAPAAPGSPPAPATAPTDPVPTYEPDVVIVEVILEWNDFNEWRVAVDVGLQRRPGEWVRVPWWHKEGIAASNELIRVQRLRSIPALWSVNTPTTAEAVCAYLKDYFLPTAKALNPDYAGVTPVGLKPKDFERGVVHPFMRVLPADYGSVSVLVEVFFFNTVNGQLQALMFYGLLAALFLMTLRLALLTRPPWRDVLGTAELQVQIKARHLQGGTRNLLPLEGALNPGRAAVEQAARIGLATPEEVAEVRARVETVFQANQVGLYILRQLEAWVIYFGLLGTLLFLSLAIMQLRIHPSTAVMQSILASMSITMAQAFLTTIVSSTLQRFMESVREALTAREERTAAEALESLNEFYDG